MKTTSILYLSILFVTGTLFTGCMSSEQKKEAADAKVEAAQENLNDMQKKADVMNEKAATAQEWKTFKLESELKIKNNEVSIAKLKLKMNEQGSTPDVIYVRKIDSLEFRNKNLKTRMGNYELTHSDWTKFKEDFNRDLNEVAFRIKELVK